MLVAVTGLIASGKSTVIDILGECGYTTVRMDDIVNKWYRYPNEVYKTIKYIFGDYYVNEKFVNKQKLLLAIINDNEKLNLLNNLLRPFFVKFLKKLKNKYKNKLIFVEMGNLMSNFCHFGKYFDKIIVVERNFDKRKPTLEKKYKKVEKFSTIDVERIENTFKKSKFVFDFIVENNEDIDNLRKKIVFLIDKIK